jgi:hypothetical protein
MLCNVSHGLAYIFILACCVLLLLLLLLCNSGWICCTSRAACMAQLFAQTRVATHCGTVLRLGKHTWSKILSFYMVEYALCIHSACLNHPHMLLKACSNFSEHSIVLVTINHKLTCSSRNCRQTLYMTKTEKKFDLFKVTTNWSSALRHTQSDSVDLF